MISIGAAIASNGMLGDAKGYAAKGYADFGGGEEDCQWSQLTTD